MLVSFLAAGDFNHAADFTLERNHKAPHPQSAKELEMQFGSAGLVLEKTQRDFHPTGKLRPIRMKSKFKSIGSWNRL